MARETLNLAWPGRRRANPAGPLSKGRPCCLLPVACCLLPAVCCLLPARRVPKRASRQPLKPEGWRVFIYCRLAGLSAPARPAPIRQTRSIAARHRVGRPASLRRASFMAPPPPPLGQLFEREKKDARRARAGKKKVALGAKLNAIELHHHHHRARSSQRGAGLRRRAPNNE